MLTIFQTADAFNYFDMLVCTSRTVREFCRRSGTTYECFIGVKRGYWSWQATYNRISIFTELYNRGWRSWVLYMDADAYVVDLDFDIWAYLARVERFGAVLVRSGATPAFWDVNAGVLMLNLGSDTGVTILKRWQAAFDSVPEGVLRGNQRPFTGPEDQYLLHDVLRADESLWPNIHLESPDLINSPHASFIRQILRSLCPDMISRVNVLTAAVDNVLGGPGASGIKVYETAREEILSAVYQSLLGRDADTVGLQAYGKSLATHGIERGLREVLISVLGSEEYRRRAK